MTSCMSQGLQLMPLMMCFLSLHFLSQNVPIMHSIILLVFLDCFESFRQFCISFIAIKAFQTLINPFRHFLDNLGTFSDDSCNHLLTTFQTFFTLFSFLGYLVKNTKYILDDCRRLQKSIFDLFLSWHSLHDVSGITK